MTNISPPLTTSAAARPSGASGPRDGSGPVVAEGDSLGAATREQKEGEPTMQREVEDKEQPEQPNSVMNDDVQHTGEAHGAKKVECRGSKEAANWVEPDTGPCSGT